MTEEAALEQAILNDPSDALARLALADWCEENGRRHRALYLRQIRPHKLRKLIFWYGPLALLPLQQMPPRVANHYDYWEFPPPSPSDRCLAWIDFIIRGWRVPKHLKGEGYDGAAQYFGVFMWEYLNRLSPLLAAYGWRRHHPHEPPF